MYYGWSGKVLLFGSELKSLRAYPGFSGEIDRNALALFTRHNYIPTPYSIYQNVHKQIPGTILSFPFDQAGFIPNPEVFWSARNAVEAGLADPFTGTETEAEEQLESLLREISAPANDGRCSVGSFSFRWCGFIRYCGIDAGRKQSSGKKHSLSVSMKMNITKQNMPAR